MNLTLHYYDVYNDNYALYWRLQGLTSYGNKKWMLFEVEFHGSQLKA